MDAPSRDPNVTDDMPEPGDVVAERYVIEEVLGSGAMGVVMRARHKVLGHPVAIKFVRASVAGDSDVLDRFVREARLTATLGDEHIARAIDFGTWGREGGTPFIVMEHFAGRDLLKELRARGALPIAEAVEYVVQASRGLAAAHARGIIHRDVKLSNLFVTRRADGAPLVKVLDFGISKAPKQSEDELSLTATGATLGSPMYMSPEQLRLARSVDARTDVWSLGVVAYLLLTGRPPFEGEGITALSAAIAADVPRPIRALRADASPELEAIVARCLEKDPSWRFASADELARALAALPLERGASRIEPSAGAAESPESPTAGTHVVTSARPSVAPRRARAGAGWLAAGVVALAASAWWLRPHAPQAPETTAVASMPSEAPTAGPLPVPATSATAAASARETPIASSAAPPPAPSVSSPPRASPPRAHPSARASAALSAPRPPAPAPAAPAAPSATSRYGSALDDHN